jgi:hypothetical protein
VLLARGDLDRFDAAVAAAEHDWRDVLVFTGLGNEDWRQTLDVELGT